MTSTNERDSHFFLAGWNGAWRNVNASEHFQNVSKTAPASCLHQIQEPAPVQVAPAVVAVPDERAAFEAHIKARPNYFDGMLANGKYANCFKVIDIDNQWIGWKARALSCR